jgi:hypothetical protein
MIKGLPYLVHSFFFGFISMTLALWLILRQAMSDPLVVLLHLLQALFLYVALFSFFLFLLECFYSVMKSEKNQVQHRITVGLFSIVNFLITGILLFFTYTSSLPSKILALELKSDMRHQIQDISVLHYRPLMDDGFSMWIRTVTNIEVRLYQLQPHQFLANKEFNLYRVGDFSFFLHGCTDGLEISDRELTKLLLGKEINNPQELIALFSDSSSYRVMDRLRFFQQFDSVTLAGQDVQCRRISINDFKNRKHAYGAATVRWDQELHRAYIQYDEGDVTHFMILDTVSMTAQNVYQTEKSQESWQLQPSSTGVFVVNGSSNEVIFFDLMSRTAMEYRVADNTSLDVLGVIDGTNQLAVRLNGRIGYLDRRYSVSRKKMILDFFN